MTDTAPPWRGSSPGADPCAEWAAGVGLIVARGLDARGRGTSASLASAIGFCCDPDGDLSDGAIVISLSLAAAQTFPVGTNVADATTAVLSRGIFVLASAGNDGIADDEDVQISASIPEVIAAGAVDAFGVIARFSSIGTNLGRQSPNEKPEIVAPGVDLLTCGRAGTYRLVSGTSASAAFVAGILALVFQYRHEYTQPATALGLETLKTVLMGTAATSPGQGLPHDPHYGYGLIQGLSLADALPWGRLAAVRGWEGSGGRRRSERGRGWQTPSAGSHAQCALDALLYGEGGPRARFDGLEAWQEPLPVRVLDFEPRPTIDLEDHGSAMSIEHDVDPRESEPRGVLGRAGHFQDLAPAGKGESSQGHSRIRMDLDGLPVPDR